MQHLERIITSIGTHRYDDDFVDRLNYIYTPSMMAIFAVTIVAKQYVGQPIQCWVPAQFKPGWQDYAENYCFVENTYYVTMNEHFPREIHERKSREIQYYQWVPFMLAVQILFFILPKALWNAFNWKTGLNISAFAKAARPTLSLKCSEDITKEAVDKLSEFLKYNMERRKSRFSNLESQNINHGNIFLSSRNFVTVIYIIFKIFNLLNCLVQLYILNNFLGTDYTFWGWGILVDLFHNRSWQQSGHFPRVTFCDIQIREQGGNVERHTLQCVLMINMFNEKIYIFIWFWLVIMSVMNILNILQWWTTSVSHAYMKKFVINHLTEEKNIDGNSKKFEQFVFETLGRDGITCLRLIEQNAGEMTASLIIAGLWKKDFIDDKAFEHSKCFDAPDNIIINGKNHNYKQTFENTCTVPRLASGNIGSHKVAPTPPPKGPFINVNRESDSQIQSYIDSGWISHSN